MVRESQIDLKETQLPLLGFSDLINWCSQVKIRSGWDVKFSLNKRLWLALSHGRMSSLRISQGEMVNPISTTQITNPNHRFA